MTIPSFRLLDLPLELQRLILKFYFDQEWNVTLRRGSRKTLASRYTFDISLTVLLSCRHIFREGTEVLRESRRGIYRLPGQAGAGGLDFTPLEPAFWDRGITCISICNWTWLCKGTQLALQRRSQRLHCINVAYDFDRGDSFTALTKYPTLELIAILDGTHDKYLSAKARFVHENIILQQGLGRTYLHETPTLLPSISHRFKVTVNKANLSMSTRMRFLLGRQNLTIEFEVNGTGCIIRKKRFEPDKRVTRRLTIADVIAAM